MASGGAGLTQAKEAFASAHRITVLTGAGVSTDSGIPDFRGPQGLWTRNPEAEKMATIHHYVADPEVRKRAWRSRLESPALTAEPNAGHKALVELERRGTLLALLTQNVDGLHQKAGSASSLVVEIHGTAREVTCLSCGERAPMERALARVRAGEDDPPCRTCGGILKSATISFGQSLVVEDLRRAERAAAWADVFLCVGTSLVVYPVAYLPQVALDSGARLIVVNAEPTPYDDRAHGVLHEPIANVLPTITALI